MIAKVAIMSAGVDHNALRSAPWRGQAIASAVSATVIAATHHVTDVAASLMRSQARPATIGEAAERHEQRQDRDVGPGHQRPGEHAEAWATAGDPLAEQCG